MSTRTQIRILVSYHRTRRYSHLKGRCYDERGHWYLGCWFSVYVSGRGGDGVKSVDAFGGADCNVYFDGFMVDVARD